MEQGQLFRQAPRRIPESAIGGEVRIPGEVKFDRWLSLPEAAEAWLVNLRGDGCKDLTIEGYGRDLRLLRRFMQTLAKDGKDMLVGEVTPWHMKQFAAWLRTRTVRGGNRATEKTVGRTITAVRSFFEFLESEKAVEVSPARGLIPVNPDSPVEPPLTEKEVRDAFLSWAGNTRHYLIGLLLIRAGLFRREALALTTEDVILSNPYRPEIVVRNENPRKTRRVVLTQDFAPVYQAFVSEWGIGGGSKLFDFSERYFNELLQGMGRAAGLKKALTSILCTNTFIAEAVRKGLTDVEIQKTLGRAPLKHSLRLQGKIFAIRQMVG